MSVLRERRVLLFIILIVASMLIIWRPWQGPELEPRGISFGLDLIGGSRVGLKIEGSIATINSKIPAENLLPQLEEKLQTSVKAIKISGDIITVEMGRNVSRDLLQAALGDNGEVTLLEQDTISEGTREEVMRTLQARADIYGTKGVSFKSMGQNFVLYEIAGVTPEEAVRLLGYQGRLEAFVGDVMVYRGTDIERVSTPQYEAIKGGGIKYHVPLRISDEGAARFAEAARGKAGYPLVFYIDRPDDAVLIFSDSALKELYDENRQMFFVAGGQYGYYLQVPAIRVEGDRLTPDTSRALRALGKQRVIFLGDQNDFSENLVNEIKRENFAVEFKPKDKNESTLGWLQRVCGQRTAPTISEEVAKGVPLKDVEITGERTSIDQARADATYVQAILSQRLPAKVTVEWESSVSPVLGSLFREEIVRAGIAAFIAVSAIVFFRYRKISISASIIGTMASELILILGMASLIRWTIGLPEIGGLVAVIGTGVDHQIIITDEILSGRPTEQKKVSGFGDRVSKAFYIIFSAAAATISAMIPLAYLGFGAMRGFALVTIIGIFIAIFITRPVYAKIVSALIAREQKSAAQ
jgi:preprotein translocase subunit SecD